MLEGFIKVERFRNISDPRPVYPVFEECPATRACARPLWFVVRSKGLWRRALRNVSHCGKPFRAPRKPFRVPRKTFPRAAKDFPARRPRKTFCAPRETCCAPRKTFRAAENVCAGGANVFRTHSSDTFRFPCVVVRDLCFPRIFTSPSDQNTQSEASHVSKRPRKLSARLQGLIKVWTRAFLAYFLHLNLATSQSALVYEVARFRCKT